MTEQAPDRLWSGIQISKIVAGTLAAVSAAVVGSFLGVAGTLVGAAIASVVGSVGTEIYQRSLDRGAKKLQTLAPGFVKAPAAMGTPEVAAATEDDSPSRTVPEVLRQEPAVAAPRSGIRWGRVGLAAAALFLLAMIPLTIVEAASGRTLANLVGSSTATGTSVGTAVTGNQKEAPATTPSEEETTTSPTDEPADPRPTPTTTDPETEPTTTPTTPAPTTEEPQQQTAPTNPPQDDEEQNQQGSEQQGTTE